MMKLTVLMLAAALVGGSVSAQTAGGEVVRQYAASRPIQGQYIVVFKQNVTNAAALSAQLEGQSGAQVLYRYQNSIKGFAARMSPQAAEALMRNPNVELVEQDATVSLSEAPLQPPLTQTPATWGLDRVDQSARPLDGNYTYRYTGAGVYAFVIDTGILAGHSEFGDRRLSGFSAIVDATGDSDCNGHGTHVAGTVGGTNYGVAKGVWLVPVRVLGCNGSGTSSGVVAGVDWVAGRTDMRPAVANMSLGGGLSTATNSAVARAVAAGVTMVVAAGNDNRNACNYSPASEPSAITVGSTTNTDARSSFSNFGTCVDIFAPGSSITSAWHTSTTAINTISGTSMASPHVAGAAALRLAANPTATPAQVATAVITSAVSGVVTSAGTGSPNLLVQTMADPVAPVDVAISSLTATTSKSSRGWAATATVRVGQASSPTFGVTGATVTGRWSSGADFSCVTGANGTCAGSTGTLKNTVTSVTLTISNISGRAMVYQPDSNATTAVTVVRPQ
jgi:subtilisin family serine protease